MDTIIRLGILDTVPPEFIPEGEKTDPAKFVDMFRDISASLSFKTYNATQGDFPDSLAECDAYLITGSPCSVYDTYTWIKDLENFIHHAYNAFVPLVGVYFGHQAIAQTLGGKVQLADKGWLLGLYSFNISVEKSWMRGSASSHSLYFINQDQVVTPPPDVQLLAGSEDCPHAMFCQDDRLLCIQAHPEQPLSSMQTFTQMLIDQYHIDQKTAEHAHETMSSGEPDAQTFARWISEFLHSSLR